MKMSFTKTTVPTARKPARIQAAVALSIAAASVIAARSALATARVSTDIDGSFWSATGSWSGGVVPVNGDTVTLGTTTSANSSVSILYTSTYTSTGLTSLTLNSTVVGNITLAQSLGTMIAATEIIGDTVTGNTYSQNGGNNTATSLVLGNQAGGGGGYTLSGSGNVTASNLNVGNGGTGTFTQSGGNVSVSTFLGVGGGNVATTSSYNLSGGNLTLVSGAYMAVGGVPHASFIVSGGVLNLNGAPFYLDNSSIAGNTVTATLSSTGSIINAGLEEFGNVGTGNAVFTQSGGTHTFGVGGDLDLGNAGAATYVLSNGTLSTYSAAVGDNFGGTFNQSGGNHTNSSGIVVGYGNAGGTYNLSGGNFSSPSVVIAYFSQSVGTFYQSGGNSTISNLTLGQNTGASANYTMDSSVAASKLTVINEVVGNVGGGNFTQNNGTHLVTATLSLGAQAGSSGNFFLNGGNLTIGSVATPGSLLIGNAGGGNFLQTGGNLSLPGASYVALSSYTSGGTGSGSYQINAGSFSAATMELGSSSGSFSFFTQHGGAVSLTNFNIATSGNEYSDVTLSNSTGPANLTVTNEVIAFSGNGTVTQIGGSHTVTGNLTLGQGDGGNGTYSMQGGTLIANALIDGAYGVANFTQLSGTVTLGTGGAVINQLGTAGPGATYTLAGGILSVPNATGAFIVNAGGTFSQSQGYAASSVFGYITNYGTFSYTAGNFYGTLENDSSGTVTLASGSAFIAGTTILNKGSISVFSNTTIGGGTGTFDNEDNITLAGGTIAGTAPILNNGLIFGFGSVAGSGGFTNNGYLSAVNGNILFSTTGTNINAGTIALTPGHQFTLSSSSSLTNNGTFSLANGLVNGAGLLFNAAPGSLIGPGTITSPFINTGSVSPGAGTLLISSAWTNNGFIQPTGVGSELTGGLITNNGSIQGAGVIAAAVNNNGTVEATGGNLVFTAALTNNGTLRASPGNKILIQSTNFPTNAGLIDLAGGTFDDGGQPLNNTGTIAGFGVLSTGGAGLTNSGNITFTGGTATINGAVTNTANHTLNIKYQPALFTGNVTNNANATLKTTSTTATFTGTFTNNGSYLSDPATNIFSVLTNGGLMSGGVGDVFTVTPGGSFTNTGTFSNGGTLNAGGNITNSGTFTQTGPQSWSANSGFTNTAGLATFGSNAKLADLLITGGTVNTTTSQLVIESVSRSTTLAALQADVAAGSLTSSTLAPNLALAVIDNGSLATPFATFGGLPVDANSILIAPELLGDANADGKVDLNDLNAVMNDLGTTTASWTAGNFDHAATIDLNDLNAVLNHLGTTYANSSTVIAAEAFTGTASPNFSVPEPASLTLLALGAPLLIRRRRA